VGPAGPAGAAGTAVPICVSSEGKVKWGVCSNSGDSDKIGTTYYMIIKS
jgi:hypothetical protein